MILVLVYVEDLIMSLLTNDYWYRYTGNEQDLRLISWSSSHTLSVYAYCGEETKNIVNPNTFPFHFRKTAGP